MKKVILIITVLIFTSHSNSQGWVQHPSGTTDFLNSVYFTDINTGFIAGGRLTPNRQILLKTTNGGNNWFSIQTGDTNYLFSIYFKNNNTGFTSGAWGTILKTTNAGINWERINLGINNFLYDIHFSGTTGLLVGSGKILRTTDDGSSWVTLYSSSGKGTAIYYSVYLINSSIAVSCGWITVSGPPYIRRTTNAGTNWTYLMNSTGLVFDYGFSDLNTGYFPAENGNIYKTINGGVNWTAQNFGNTDDLNGISVISSDIITTVGDNGKIFRTTNGGVNWQLQSTPVSTNLQSVFFLNPNIGYTVGSNGVILKTTTGGLTSFHTISNSIPNKFSLSQNYPNPFNPTTNIEFSIPKSGHINLIIYDATGREVATLVNEELTPGTYKADWNASAFPSGVYFYKLSSADYTETKKMIIVK
jgi:photosystem II stability/assembly factor-like uncharacterized protein